MSGNGGLWFFLGAVLTAGVTAISLFITNRAQTVHADNHRYSSGNVEDQLSYLNRELKELKDLQARKSEESGRAKPNRRRRVTSDASSASTSTFRTGICSDESEYYDLSTDTSTDEDSSPISKLNSTDASLSSKKTAQELESAKSIAEIDSASKLNHTQSNKNTSLSIKKIDEQLDSAKSIAEIDRALNGLRDANNNENQEVLWRIGKACKIRLTMCDTDEEKIVYLDEGTKACMQAITLPKPSANCYKWLAILHGVRCEISSTQDRIKYASLFRENIEKAIKLYPFDNATHYLYGRYLYELSQLNWFERTACSAIMGSLPSCAVNDALNSFMKAESFAVSPDRENRVYIAKCYTDLMDVDNARKWLRKIDETEMTKDKKIIEMHQEVKEFCK